MPGGGSPRVRDADPRRAGPAPREAGARRARPRPSRTGSEASSRGGGLSRGRAVRRIRRLRGGAGLALFGPGHHGAQLGPHTLDRVVILALAERLEPGAPRPGLLNPLTG